MKTVKYHTGKRKLKQREIPKRKPRKGGSVGTMSASGKYNELCKYVSYIQMEHVNT